jgi:hypothetical protein
MRTRLVVSGAIGLFSGVLTWFLLQRLGLGAADFNWAYDAARALVAGRNPYLGTPSGVIPYPLPAALFALPFAWLSRGAAAGAFFGTSSAILAYGLTKQGYLRLLVFLCYPYWAAMITAQWTPLLAASACFPLLLPLTVAKPHIGLPVALTNLSQRGVVGLLAVLALSFLMMPSWLWQWIPQLGGYQHFFPVLVVPGFLLLLAGLRYRDQDSRLLLLASLVPQRWFYDPMILFLIPKTRRELIFTLGFSWLLGVWRWYHNPQSMNQVGLWSVLGLYLPMLAVVLLREAKTERVA